MSVRPSQHWTLRETEAESKWAITEFKQTAQRQKTKWAKEAEMEEDFWLMVFVEALWHSLLINKPIHIKKRSGLLAAQNAELWSDFQKKKLHHTLH